MINRAKLRGARLDEDCKYANTTTEADLCVCYGLIDNAENLLPKCKQAKAMQEYVDVLGERIKDLIDNG